MAAKPTMFAYSRDYKKTFFNSKKKELPTYDYFDSVVQLCLVYTFENLMKLIFCSTKIISKFIEATGHQVNLNIYCN